MNDAIPALVETGAGFTVLFRGLPLYPADNPKTSAERKAASLVPAANTLYLVPSPLLGYGLETLLAGLPESSSLLCVEREPALAGLLSESSAAEKLTPPAGLFVAGDSSSSILQSAVKLGIHRFRRVVLLTLNRGFQLHRSFYEDLRDDLLELTQNHWRNRMTTLNLGRLWVKNLILNLPSCGAGRDAGRIEIDRPVMLFGAGVSLEAGLPLAARRRDRLFIAAVDTALPALAKAGLTPDLVVAADSQWANLGDFVGDAGGGYALAADLTAYPAIVRRHSGNLFLFLSRFYELNLLEQLAQSGLAPLSIPPLGSVGVMAYRLVRQVFAGPLFLAGLDFHYENAKTHARGTPSHDGLIRACMRFSPPACHPAVFDRPFIRQVLADGRVGTADAVLFEYNRQFCRLTAGDRQIYDLSASGLPRPIPRVTIEQADRLIADYRHEASSNPSSVGEAARAPSGHRIDGFLASLEADLQKTAALLGREPAPGLDEEAALAGLLEKLDFLYFDFPDFPPAPRPDGQIRGRLLASSLWYLEKVRRARQINRRRS